ncbi:MAG: hypothetical protein ACI8X5_002501 [Planctomycetota bacterium]|jgi:hypothetical protein
MSSRIQTREFLRLALSSCAAAGLATVSSAQSTFSIDWHSPTLAVPDSCTGVPITEGDILITAGGMTAFGPLPTPCIAIPGGAGGLGLFNHATCVGHPAGSPCRIEVDALSYGRDYSLGSVTSSPGDFLFSTDEFAIAGVPPLLAPSINTEAPVGDSATDVWVNGDFMGFGPFPPFSAAVGHTAAIDGDGTLSGSGMVYPGTGLLEPTFPGPPPNTGDNLDAYDFNESLGSGSFPTTGVYFSVEGFIFDPLSGTAGSAADIANGVASSDVLISMAPGGPPAVYAPGPVLGLDLFGGKDDLDALALAENGVPGYQPSQQAYDWVPAGGSDMLLFSVRRGSSVIGMPDSIFGIPITEGDILTTPLPTFLGGVSPFPGIFCAAENIGLSSIRIPGGFIDDLNALDTINLSYNDCNGNGVDDFIDILNGTSADADFDGVPDECSGTVGIKRCFCPNFLAPCANPFPTAGCRNSTGLGAAMCGIGSDSVFADDLVLLATEMPATVPAIIFGGTAFVGPFPFGDGLRCAGGNIVRFTSPTLTSATGTLSAGPGLAGTFGIVPTDVWTFQCWFRDPTGPCGFGFNTTNSVTVSFTL